MINHLKENNCWSGVKREYEPCVDIESATRCRHVNAGWLKWKFAWKY